MSVFYFLFKKSAAVAVFMCDCKCQSKLGGKDSNMELLTHLQISNFFMTPCLFVGTFVKFNKIGNITDRLVEMSSVFCFLATLVALDFTLVSE